MFEFMFGQCFVLFAIAIDEPQIFVASGAADVEPLQALQWERALELLAEMSSLLGRAR